MKSKIPLTFLSIYAESDKGTNEIKERAAIMARLAEHVEKNREKLINKGLWVFFNKKITFIDYDCYNYSITGVDGYGELSVHCNTFCQVIPNSVTWQYLSNKVLAAVVDEYIACV